jgi:hypothetical protein
LNRSWKTKETLDYASFALKDILRFIAGEATLSADPVAVAQQADDRRTFERERMKHLAP